MLLVSQESALVDRRSTVGLAAGHCDVLGVAAPDEARVTMRSILCSRQGYQLDKFFSVISYLYLHFILPKCDSGLSNITKSTQPDALTGGGVQIFDRYLTLNIS